MRELLKQNWVILGTYKKCPVTEEISKAVTLWKKSVEHGKNVAATEPERYIEIYYEDILRYPEQTLRELFFRLGEPWEPSVLDFHKKELALSNEDITSHGDSIINPLNMSSLGRWRQELDNSQLEQFYEVSGDLLKELGYEK